MSKNVIITGTSSGIGFELVKLFSENNNNILAISRNNKTLRMLDLPGVTSLDLDLTESEDLSLLDKHLKSFKNVDILINNAGHLVNKSFEETTLKDFQDVYSTNVFSVAMLTKKVIKFMSASSNVVNISSIGGVQGSVKFSGLSAYSSSKAALNILTEMLAEEFKERKIHFNSLALGSVETKMLKKAFPDFKASNTAQEMANYIYEFSIAGYKFLNGKIVSVSSSTP